MDTTEPTVTVYCSHGAPGHLCRRDHPPADVPGPVGRVLIDSDRLEHLVRSAHQPVVDTHPLISTIDEELLDGMRGACICGVDFGGTTSDNAALARLAAHVRDELRSVGL